MLRGLEPGEWRISIEPGGSNLLVSSSCPYLPLVRELRLSAGEHRRLQLELALGGRLAIVVDGTNLEPGVAAACALVDARGESIPVRFVTRRSIGGELEIAVRPGRIERFGRSEVLPALPAGRYELRILEDGWQAPPLVVDVAAGRTNEVTLGVSKMLGR